jgi:hypothetical protein
MAMNHQNSKNKLVQKREKNQIAYLDKLSKS